MGNACCFEFEESTPKKSRFRIKRRVKKEDKKGHSPEKEIVPSTTRNMTCHYTVHYPEHEKRVSSSIYRKTHEDMCNVKKIPCFICGKKQNSENKEYLETHHFYCEKAAQNAINWKKFGEFAKTCHNIQTGENIGESFDWKEVEQNPDIFVDSPYNMIVLCKEHHISGNTTSCSLSGLDFTEIFEKRVHVFTLLFIVNRKMKIRFYTMFID
jgi:hypothetical protein